MSISNSALPERPYPLQWPESWGRTPNNKRTHAPYRAPLEDSRDVIISELRMIVAGRSNGHISCMLSSDMITRRDGSFYDRPEEPTDPGAAVWWIDSHGDTCAIACDAWDTVQGNFRAIALNIRHMRAVERTRATQIFARLTQSFKIHALAAANPVPAKPKCAEILGLEHWPVQRKELDAAFRRLAKAKHPDQPGNDPEVFSQISGAYADCASLLAG